MLKAIAAWELDAALEPPERMFLRTKAIAKIEAGAAGVVVGPRGAGKTAASRLITATGSGDRRAARLGLKDVFMAAMRPLAAASRSPAEAARSSASARYLILLTAFETLMEEQLLGGAQIQALARKFSVRLDAELAGALELVFNRSILYEVFGDGGPLNPALGEVVDEIADLERAMAEALGRRRALVLLDEAVDRSIVAAALDELRIKAFHVLLEGASDLSRGPAGRCIAPVVFTRPGVFDRLPEADRIAWGAKRLDLSWTARELRSVLDHRIASAVPKKFGRDPERPAGALERHLSRAVRGVPGAGGEAWSYIWPRTRARACDAVFFVRAAARNARHRDVEAFDGESFIQAEKAYSAYLLADMADEIRDVAPDTDAVMRALASIAGQVVEGLEFVDLIERTLATADVDDGEAGARAVIERCYESSVIGNFIGEGRAGKAQFVHSAPAAGFDYTLPVVVHPGVLTALDLNYAAAA